MTAPDPRDPAQARLQTLLAMRALGVASMLAGLGIWLGHRLGEAGQVIGPLLFVAGAVGSLLLPAILARRWRTPRP